MTSFTLSKVVNVEGRRFASLNWGIALTCYRPGNRVTGTGYQMRFDHVQVGWPHLHCNCAVAFDVVERKWGLGLEGLMSSSSFGRVRRMEGDEVVMGKEESVVCGTGNG